MVFIDNLGFELDALILVTTAAFYTGFWVWWFLAKHDPKKSAQELRGGGFILGFLGVFLSVLGFWGELTWPLPASYNLLFYDPTLLLGLILVGFSACLALRVPTHYLGMVASVSGLGVIYYGTRAYLLGLTQEPLAMFGLFAAFGAMGVLAFPVTLFIDRFVLGNPGAAGDPSSTATPSSIPMLWRIPLGLFLAMAVVAGIAALVLGFDTAWSHLAKAP